MKKSLYPFLMLLSCFGINNVCADELSGTLKSGANTVNLAIANPSGFTATAFQCDIELPDGVTVDKKTGSTEFDVSMDAGISQTHQIASNVLSDGTLRILCYSMDLSPLTDGAVASFKVTSTGDSKQFTIKNVELADANSISRNSGIVTAAQNAIVIKDSEGYTGTSTMTNVTVNYSRSFSTLNWQALYVPFSMTYEEWADNFDIAKLNAYYEYDDDLNGEIDRQVLEFLYVKKGTLKPNHPYLIRAKKTGQYDIVANNSTLEAAANNFIDCSTVETTYYFGGVPALTMNPNPTGCQWYTLTSGSLRKAAGVNGLRWYMYMESRNPQVVTPSPQKVSIRVVGGDEEATVIDLIEDVNAAGSPAIYGIDGRVLKNMTTGVNVIVNPNGETKKIIIK